LGLGPTQCDYQERSNEHPLLAGPSFTSSLTVTPSLPGMTLCLKVVWTCWM